MAELEEVMGENTPTNPAGEAELSMLKAAVESVSAFDHTDATFNASLPAAAETEPGLVLPAGAGLILSAKLREDHALDAELVGIGFVLRGGHAAVGAG